MTQVIQLKGGKPVLDFRKLELNTTEPVYVQIVSFVKRQILTGEAEKGESLPSRRELAAILKINPNTVQKAFRLMEEEKIIETPPHAVSVIHWDDTVFARLRRELTAGFVADFHRRSLQLSQLLILQHLQTSKVKLKQVNQPSPKEIQMFQSMKILQLPSKMAQLRRLSMVKELTQ